MASLGWYLIMGGVASGLLSAFDYEFSLLMWIDTWGNGFAWLIRGAFILIGLALVQRGTNQQQQAEQPASAQQRPVS